MSNATPGPWCAEQSRDGRWYVWMDRDADMLMEAVAGCFRTPTEQEANARLIAAAPRMAAALQRAAFVLAELPQSEQTPRVLALREEIIATINQATPEYYGAAADFQP